MADEQTVFKGHSSPSLFFGTFLLSSLLMLGAVAFAIFASRQPWSPDVRMAIWVLPILPLLWMLQKWIVIKSRVYEITDQRVKVSSGLVSRKTEELELYRVKDTTLVEPFFLRLFSAGNIVITTSDASDPHLKLEAIPNASTVRELLRTHIEATRDRKRARITEIE